MDTTYIEEEEEEEEIYIATCFVRLGYLQAF
jgi:hypothetical protein